MISCGPGGSRMKDRAQRHRVLVAVDDDGQIRPLVTGLELAVEVGPDDDPRLLDQHLLTAHNAIHGIWPRNLEALRCRGRASLHSGAAASTTATSSVTFEVGREGIEPSTEGL